ncbi:PssD/Cps14F family polysaccharide biosynthesis glycosyltransferase [Thermococcus sp. 2319x1]|uniref:PssD/Cps14F family polysaccharide biosynthesis glycosyltransferase n=1 Tax=Thermococcus sp. 2319x1 TaxID=1674923 RepID=UPI001582AFEA|nr:PssD/Cps14F family polysaccharide biosynthesis glycosyltransferase [Thermococcus sp. 2319x1]
MVLKILLACESGGHLTQGIYLIENLKLILERRYGEDVEVVLLSENTKRVRELNNPAISKKYTLSMPRFSKKLFRYLQAFFPQTFIKVARILKSEKVDVVISTAGWVSIPTFILAKLVFGIKTVYVHSWSRVHQKSDSGRLLYYLSDLFIVQWPQLLGVYGEKAKYFGGIL